ncbi:ATP-binding protein [Alkalihalobacterium alkalicellulosilyticum]|uniref:ATP-binding protein n=1 Tax=Alkalihalobacterium alkalicellulosilyticum TaxID=1912214 RepID=UPI000997455F|nr:ATP-binding protein [Bacillus alkalicellulosilyticus]
MLSLQFTLPCRIDSISYFDQVIPYAIEQYVGEAQPHFSFAIHELLINSLEAVHTQFGKETSEEISVDVTVNEVDMIVTVTDNAGGLSEEDLVNIHELRLEDIVFQERGRGLLMVKELVDKLTFSKEGEHRFSTKIRKRR